MRTLGLHAHSIGQAESTDYAMYGIDVYDGDVTASQVIEATTWCGCVHERDLNSSLYSQARRLRSG